MPKDQGIQKELRSLHEELARIRKEVDLLGKGWAPGESLIPPMLKQRGFQYLKGNPLDQLIIPRGCGESMGNEFYELLKRYSFRIFLRDVIKNKNSFGVKDLVKYCSETTARRYLRSLLSAGIVSPRGRGRYQLFSQSIRSFGDTFEWFIAELLSREFAIPSLWGVKLAETQSGGDYDVMGKLGPYFLYIEVKSSPPKHIEQQEISAFFNRVEEIAPDIAIFLEDTHLRMKDKIVVMFEEEISNRYPKQTASSIPVQRLVKELFHLRGSIFIVNTKPDLVSNLSHCFRFFFQQRHSLSLG